MAPDEDTAAAVLAGLIETVRVMEANAQARGIEQAGRDYGAALALLNSAAVYLHAGGDGFDAFTSPVDKITGRLS